jgi:hypothetical protein
VAHDPLGGTVGVFGLDVSRLAASDDRTVFDGAARVKTRAVAVTAAIANPSFICRFVVMPCSHKDFRHAGDASFTEGIYFLWRSCVEY